MGVVSFSSMESIACDINVDDDLISVVCNSLHPLAKAGIPNITHAFL